MKRLLARKGICLLAVLVLVMVLMPHGTAVAASPIYVDDSATGTPDGSSWTDAYTDLQDALTGATDGDEIWVAEGTYKPTDGTDRSATFNLVSGVAVYGGFAGTEDYREERDWVANPAILSGDIGTAGDTSDNSYHVVVGADNATLDGFTITGGNANGGGGDSQSGGGMYNDNSSPAVTNCTFSENSAFYRGGGMFNDNSFPTVTDCTFSENSVAIRGGGMYNSYVNRDINNHDFPSPTVTDCTFSGNSAGSQGGGMYNYYFNYHYSDASFSPTVTGCTFSGNSAGSFGAGMYNHSSSPTVTDCGFYDNSAVHESGGGMYNYSNSSPTVTGCTFSGNSARYGGGMYNSGFCSPTVTNCTFSSNSAGSFGGGMCNSGSSSPTVTNCTFSENSARNAGGMSNHCVGFSSFTVTNCTFSGNSAGSQGGGMYNSSSSLLTGINLTNCTFSGNSAGDEGGGMCNIDASSLTVTNCAFSANSAGDEGGDVGGGGMFNYDSSLTVTNCTFSGNSADYGDGGGMCNKDSSLTVTNCTFYGNSAVSMGGGVYNISSSPTVTNCILWNNSPDQINNYESSNPVVSYSDIEDQYIGLNNINADPRFADPINGDFHLLTGSPCIDAGSDNAVPEWLTTDFEGDDRIMGAAVDMGVDEFAPMAAIIQVTIDIKPGSDPNSINLKSKGVVPVAVLTTDDFDAGEIDPATVVFAGAEPERWTTCDVDDDGDLDMLFHFKTQELDLTEDSEDATLTGKTTDDHEITGTDSVRIVPQKGKK